MKLQKVCVLLVALSACTKRTHDRRLAHTYYEQAVAASDQHKALNLIDQSLELDETNAQARAFKATLLYQLGNFKEAACLFEQLIADKHINRAMRADAQNNWASALYQLGQTDEAENLWRGLTTDPHYISPELAYFNLGLMRLDRALKLRHEFPYERRVEFEALTNEAIELFKQALTVAREYVDALFYLGVSHLELNNLEKAREYFVSVLTINPEHGPAKHLLGRAHTAPH